MEQEETIREIIEAINNELKQKAKIKGELQFEGEYENNWISLLTGRIKKNLPNYPSTNHFSSSSKR